MNQQEKIKRNSIIIMIIFTLIFAVAIIYTLFSPKKIAPQTAEYFRKINFKTFGGPMSETAWDLGTAPDGGYVICGTTASFGAGKNDAYLVKTDSMGNMDWARTFGGELDDDAISLVCVKDGFVFAGGTMSFGNGAADIYMMKVDYDGDCVWAKTYGGKDYDYAYSINKTNDGGFIVAGYTAISETSDVYLLKTDKNGNKIWDKTYGSYGWDIAYSAVQDRDNGYIVSGYTTSIKNDGSGSLIYLIKTDAEGDCVWARTYGGVRENRGYYAVPDIDGGYIVSSKTTSFISKGVGWDTMTFKVDAKGNSLWTNFIPASSTEVGKSIVINSDKQYLIGTTKKCYGICDTDVYLEVLDAGGNTVMTRIFSGPANDSFASTVLDSQGNYVICGTTSSNGNGRSDMFLMKIGKNGEQIW
jgi:hypothetical protein